MEFDAFFYENGSNSIPLIRSKYSDVFVSELAI